MNFKKALSLALATAMIGGVASVASFAAPTLNPKLDSGAISDKGLSGIDTVFSDNTVYVRVADDLGGKAFKFSSKKGDNAKLIKKISLVEKQLAGDSTRHQYVKIEINEDMTDKEYKMNPTYTFTAKEIVTVTDMNGDTYTFAAGEKHSVTIKFWIKNGQVAGGTDQANMAGQTGYFAKPVKNDDNEVIWSDINRDLAKLTFTGDSDVSAYYPKLSTKWANDVYAANFANGEAFKFEFVGNAAISATARPVLTIYNPFVDDNEEYTVDASELTVYQLIDDEFVNVTDKFTAGTDDDGNQVLTTKTRTLGYYVVCDEAAAASGDITTDEPTKDIPSTGR